MSLYIFPPLISSILFFCLGIFVLLQNRKSTINISFFLSCLTTSWWQFSWAFLFSTSSLKLASILIKIGYSGIIFIPITILFHFYVNFLGAKKDNILVYLSYIFGFILLLFLWFSNWLINGYYTFFWGFYPKANFMHLLYLLFLALLSARAFFLLINNLIKEKNALRRNQIRYVLFAFLVYNLAASDFIVNWGVGFYPLGFVAILISLAIIAYSMLHHRLLDIEVVIKRTAVYSILMALITGIFLSIILASDYLVRAVPA